MAGFKKLLTSGPGQKYKGNLKEIFYRTFDI